jgi:hypothetical protein
VTGTYNRQRRYDRRKAADVADIGVIPAVVNPARRAACERNLHLFLSSYFPKSTGLSPFGPDHSGAIKRIEICGLEGGDFGQAFPRGGAKTTISENSAIWVLLYGHRDFTTIFGADSDAAGGNIDSIKLELAENDLLEDDFPEVCHAIRALEGKPQRCGSQTHKPGNVEGWIRLAEDEEAAPTLTHIEWRGDTIVLPTIYVPEGWGTVEGPKPGAKLIPSRASGAIITTRGIMAGSRGLKHKRPDGTQVRPDFVILDDPQTDESASTPLQVNKRLTIIRKNILRLGGHAKKRAVVMNATAIRPGDMVDQISDPKKFPAWQFLRIKMMKAWGPAKDTLWLTDYARLRNTYDSHTIGDQQRAHREATAFYERNRPKMDEGHDVFWEHCYDRETERSAVQHAYNILIDDGEEVFASECQNEPLRETEEGQQPTLTADEIAEKINGHDRGAVPLDVSRVVGFVDIQKTALFWVVCGFADGFTGYVLDYGIWPEQNRDYVALSEIRRTIQKVTGKASVEESIYAAADILTGLLMGRDWKREDGAVLKPERILKDANWGESTDIIYQFCRQSPHSAVLTPSHGKYVGATSRSFAEWHPKPGDRTGLNWRMPAVQNRRQVRYVLFDSNFWKTFVHKRLATGMGGRGCLSLFGGNPQKHRLIADHLTSETPIEVEAKGRKVVEWKLKPGRPDNHFLDCLVGCHVAASMQGVGLIEKTPAKARARVKLSEIQKKAKHWGAKANA